MCVTLCGVSLTLFLCEMWAVRMQHCLQGRMLISHLHGRGWKPENYLAHTYLPAEFPFLFCQCWTWMVEEETKPSLPLSHQRAGPQTSAVSTCEVCRGTWPFPREPSATVLFPEILEFAGFLISSVALSESESTRAFYRFCKHITPLMYFSFGIS